ncbi:eukaryotic translation initiation factor 4G1, eIF4E-binding domain-containing protein [Trametes meyenii]|nr:eukaryotic translation initiation factor 4G1, eIF4E-binding domain-containing protein [Trametes meyenii]
MQSAPPTLTALSTARPIEDIEDVKYPLGIHGPKPELNVNAMPTKFRYDRDFLLQFMAVCKETPGPLPPLEALGLVRGPDGGFERPFYFAGLRIASPLSPKPVARLDASANSGPMSGSRSPGPGEGSARQPRLARNRGT